MGKINSKAKGKRGELYVVHKFKEAGFDCNRTAQFKGKTGRADDVEGIDYIHAEVKFVENLNISKAMEQAERDCLASARVAFPVVFHKKSREPLRVTMNFDDWLELYKEYYSSMKLKNVYQND